MNNEDIKNYISENYEILLRLSKQICNDGTHEDLLNEVLLEILVREEQTEKVKNCNNFYNYINRALRISFISKNSKYNKNFKRSVSLDNFNEDVINFLDENNILDYELNLNEKIIKIFNKIDTSNLFNNKIKNFSWKIIFFEYFFPEKLLTNDEVKKLSTEEIKEMRNKMTYSKIAKKYNINKYSVYLIIKNFKKIINNNEL
jgi:Mor family transcriptional regulator